MGYYTNYILNIDSSYGRGAREAALEAEKQEVRDSNLPPYSKAKIISMLEEKYKHEEVGIDEVLSELDEDPFECETKWYEHEEEMLAVSRKYPSVLFTLQGQGEEADDLWRKYFYDGKVQRTEAVITFPPFDPLKLE